MNTPQEGVVGATLQRREWQMTVDVSAPCPGSFKDWPSHVQDRILAAIERDCQPRKPYHELVIARSGCQRDPDPPGNWFLLVVVEELPTLLVNTKIAGVS